jgi:hypothetical protein
MGLVAIERGRLSTESVRKALVATADVRVSPALDNDRIGAALTALAGRHPMLRLRLDIHGGEAALVLGSAPVPTMHGGVMPEAGTALNVGAGELFALHVSSDGDTTRLVAHAHAAALDAASLASIVDELIGLAAGTVEAGEPTDAEVIAALARARYDAEAKASIAHRAFWVESLMDKAPELKLARRARPIAPAGLGRTQGEKSVRKLALDLSKVAGWPAAERESLVLTAFAQALADVSGQSRVLVSRTTPSAQPGLAGPFTAELPVIVNAASGGAIRAEARRVARHIAAAELHSDFDIHALERVIPVSITAMPQAAFTFTAAGASEPRLLSSGTHLVGGCTVEVASVSCSGMLHDIALAARDNGREVIAEIAFDTSALDEVTVARIVRAIVARVAELVGSGGEKPRRRPNALRGGKGHVVVKGGATLVVPGVTDASLVAAPVM